MSADHVPGLSTVGTPGRTLLLAVLRRDAAPAEWWLALSRQVDWLELLRDAGPQIVPYFGFALASTPCIALLPREIRALVEQQRRHCAATYLRQRIATRAASDALSRLGIGFVALKGSALRHLAYPDPTIRPMSDVDLWIEPGRLHEAVHLLRGEGWRGLNGGQAEGPGVLTEGSRMLVHPSVRMVVEFHDPPESLWPLPGRETGAMWTRARPAHLGGLTMRVLDPADMVLHLCMNMAKDRYKMGPRALLDLQLAVERWRDVIDWRALALRCESMGVLTRVYLALRVAHDVLAAPVPQIFFDSVDPPAHLQEMCALAVVSTLDAVSYGLPMYAAGIALPRSTSERLTRLAKRLTVYYLPREPGAWRSPARAVADSLSRLAFDVFVKGARDRRFFTQLLFDRKRLRRGVELERSRSRLVSLMDDSERIHHGLRSPSVAGRGSAATVPPLPS